MNGSGVLQDVLLAVVIGITLKYAEDDAISTTVYDQGICRGMSRCDMLLQTKSERAKTSSMHELIVLAAKSPSTDTLRSPLLQDPLTLVKEELEREAVHDLPTRNIIGAQKGLEHKASVLGTIMSMVDEESSQREETSQTLVAQATKPMTPAEVIKAAETIRPPDKLCNMDMASWGEWAPCEKTFDGDEGSSNRYFRKRYRIRQLNLTTGLRNCSTDEIQVCPPSRDEGMWSQIMGQDGVLD